MADVKYDPSNTTDPKNIKYGNLKTIVEKLTTKANDETLSEGTRNKAAKLAEKYQKTMNKTALLYQKNKEKEKIKPYKLNQLSYNKILELGGKEPFANKFENIMGATGAAVATIGLLSKGFAGGADSAIALAAKAVWDFISGDWARTAIIAGAALMAGAIIMEVAKRKKQASAALQEEIEAEVLGENDTKKKVDVVLEAGNKKALAEEALKDPMFHDHLREIATDMSGEYTEQQITNAQEILAEMENVKNSRQEAAVGFAIQGQLGDGSDKDLTEAFTAYREAHADDSFQSKYNKFCETNGFTAEKEAEAKKKADAAAFGDASTIPAVNNNLSKIKALSAQELFDLCGNADGTINDTKLLDECNKGITGTDPKLKNTDPVFTALKTYATEKTAAIKFGIDKVNAAKTAAAASTDPLDPEVLKYIEAEATLNEPDKTAEKLAIGIITSVGSTTLTDKEQKFVADKFNVAVSGFIEAVKSEPRKYLAAGLREVALGQKVEVNLKDGNKKFTNLKADSAISDVITQLKGKPEFQSALDQATQLVEKNKAAGIVQEGNAKFNDGAELYEKLIKKISKGDARLEKALREKYPDMAAIQGKFGDNLDKAAELLETKGLTK